MPLDHVMSTNRCSPLSERTIARQLRGAAIWAIFLWFLMMPGSVLAQGVDAPQRQDVISPTGVSYANGSFKYEATDLAIGGPFPQGLAVDRQYISSISPAFAQGFSTQGWTLGLLSYVSSHVDTTFTSIGAPPGGGGNPNIKPFIYNVTVGGRSIGFTCSCGTPTGGKIGTYTPIRPDGGSLVYGGSPLHYTYTDSDGSVIEFMPSDYIRKWSMPDGTVLDFNYTTNNVIQSIFSNRGYALLFETNGGSWQKACAVNLARTAITAAATACPVGAPYVTYGFSASTYNAASLLTGVTDARGNTTSYSYTGANHLGCIKLPGQTNCQVQNTYNVCQRTEVEEAAANGAPPPASLRYGDQVLSQVTATGETFTYSFLAEPICTQPRTTGTITATDTLGQVMTVSTDISNNPTVVVDQNGRQTIMDYIGSAIHERSVLQSVTYPELNQSILTYVRGNISQRTDKAKPGSGLADIIHTASYTTTCTNVIVCNKPTSVTDANGNVTSYTYDPVHGGTLTETSPPVNGIAAVKRRTFEQRRAWMADGSGGYVPATGYIWMVTSEKTCRTSATVSGGCSAGSSDEVVTAYDYGPDSGPNTLLLRGKVVTADGVSLRTCYGYDYQGRKISETSPRADLAVCS